MWFLINTNVMLPKRKVRCILREQKTVGFFWCFLEMHDLQQNKHRVDSQEPNTFTLFSIRNAFSEFHQFDFDFKLNRVNRHLQHMSRSNTQHSPVSFCHHTYKTQDSSLKEHKSVIKTHNQNTCYIQVIKTVFSRTVLCCVFVLLPSISCWVCNRNDKTWPGWAGQSLHRSCSNIKTKEVNENTQTVFTLSSIFIHKDPYRP